MALPFSQEWSNQSCSQSVTPPSCRGAARLAGSHLTLSERVAPAPGSRCSTDPPSLHTQTPPSCPEAGRWYEGRWSLWEGVEPGAESRRSFYYHWILIGLYCPGGCLCCGSGATNRFKKKHKVTRKATRSVSYDMMKISVSTQGLNSHLELKEERSSTGAT